jgi:hypothetical protein
LLETKLLRRDEGLFKVLGHQGVYSRVTGGCSEAAHRLMHSVSGIEREPTTYALPTLQTDSLHSD